MSREQLKLPPIHNSNNRSDSGANRTPSQRSTSAATTSSSEADSIGVSESITASSSSSVVPRPPSHNLSDNSNCSGGSNSKGIFQRSKYKSAVKSASNDRTRSATQFNNANNNKTREDNRRSSSSSYRPISSRPTTASAKRSDTFSSGNSVVIQGSFEVIIQPLSPEKLVRNLKDIHFFLHNGFSV
jgi:hypothetical protein